MKFLEINKEDLIHNINIVKDINKAREKNSKSPEIIAVVKGNAYGLDLIKFSKILIEQGIEFLAVATVEEALELRRNGINTKILLLSSTCNEEDIKLLIKNNIILTVGSKEDIQVIDKIAENRKVQVHLKIDTGFGRYGFIYDKPLDIINAINNSKSIEICGTFSHFSESYSKSSKWTTIQYERFLNVVENLKLNNIETGMLHICNSSAFFKYPYMRLNAVRIGSAFSGRILIPNIYGLKRIGIFKTQITEIKKLPKNFNIGYSNTYKTKRETKIAIVPVGYYDGLNITTFNNAFRLIDHLRYIYNDLKNIFKDNFMYVIIKNKKYRVIGQLGMCNLIIDLKNSDISVGEIVSIDVKMLYIDPTIRREYI